MFSQHARANFLRDCRGNVILMFALALIPMLGLLGAAVDYSRATNTRTDMAQAADAAALAAARLRQTDASANWKALAQTVFASNYTAPPDISNVSVLVEDVNGAVQVTASADVALKIAAVLGKKSMQVGVVSQAGVGGGNNLEIALALDNTGSMSGDMPALKTAVQGFVNSVMNGGQVKVAVVPFVASVNAGAQKFSLSMIDTQGRSPWQMSVIKGRPVAGWPKCFDGSVKNGGGGGGEDNGGGGGGGSGGPPVVDDGGSGPSGKDKGNKKGEADPFLPLNMFAGLSQELFGIGSAHAAEVTPRTAPALPGKFLDSYAPKYQDGHQAWLPDGWTSDGSSATNLGCLLYNPDVVANYDMFSRVAGAKWKGCVEARAEPYDVTDDPPSTGNPDTLFTPYFWPDEPDLGDDGPTNYSNNYMKDARLDSRGNAYPSDTGLTGTFVDSPQVGWHGWMEQDRLKNLMKYDGVNPAKIVEVPPETMGPNKGCPDEVLPLTTNKSTVQQKIASLGYWEDGGTIISEGLMWAWRALSPNSPYALGAPYGSGAKKIIVLMTDGINELATNEKKPGGLLLSSYTAYGYLRSGRFNPETFSAATKYLDNRLTAACNNAKAKGITIYTILFNETDNNVTKLLRSCASDPSMFYTALNDAALSKAFSEIGGNIGKLRLTK